MKSQSTSNTSQPPFPNGNPVDGDDGAKIGHGLLIGGAGSSGTTLLRKLLDRHPDVYCGPEWYVFYNPGIYPAFAKLTRVQREVLITSGFTQLPGLQPPRLGWEKTPGQEMALAYFVHPKHRRSTSVTTESLLARALRASDFWDFASSLFGHLARSRGKRLWAEKTPINCRAYGAFLDAHPQNRCIHLVRDGRDVALSLMKRGFAMSGAVDRWVRDTASYLPHAQHPRLMLVRFDDLVREPLAQFTRILEFAGAAAEPAPSILSFPEDQETKGHRRGASAVWGALPGAGIDASVSGKWRSQDTSVLAALEREFTRPVKCDQGTWSGTALLSKFGYHESFGRIPGALPAS